jgi:PAS domain S-box-containing protein
MPQKKQALRQITDETAELKNRLEETEETLRAIRQYMVDAFVVTRENGAQVVTLHNADFPYRMMVESMNEGAVTLIPDGTIFYCNPRFGEMIQSECEKLIGIRFQDLIRPEERASFEEIFREAGLNGMRGEFCLLATKGTCVPVQLSVFQLVADDMSGIAIIATDISERIETEEKIRTLASELTIAEQEERHRISQILHDDLQQRLFAIKAQLSFLKHAKEHDTSLPETQVTLDQLENWLSEAITIARNLSIDLSPIVLQGDGLSEAMTWLGSQMKERYGLQLELDAKENLDDLDDHMRVLLFQAVRELLFNIVKHAGTLHAAVTLDRVDGRGRITISDSGKGFDVEAIMNHPKSAHGLLIVQDRLSVMGGKIEVTSKPGDGTIIILEIPRKRPLA